MFKSNKNAFIFSLIVAFGGFVFGLDIALISGTVKYVQAEFNLSAVQVGMVVGGATGFGSVIALLFAGYFCDKFGRKNTLLVIAGLYLLSGLGSAFAWSYESLFVGRFLGGLAFASLSLASMYVGEIAPPKLRGILVGLNQMNIVVGIFVASLLNFYIVGVISSHTEWAESLGLVEKTSWRWMLGSEILPAAIWFFALFFIPESPRWLLKSGHDLKAERVIKRILPNAHIDEQLLQIRASLKESDHSVSLWQQLTLFFNPKYRIALLIGVGMALIQSLTGMNAVLGFIPMIFSQVGGGDSTAFLQTVWVGAIGMLFTFLSLVLIDKLGRRPILLGGLLWAGISLAIVAHGFTQATYKLTSQSVATLEQKMNVASLTPMVGIEYNSDIEFKAALDSNLGHILFIERQGDLISAAVHMNGLLILIGIISFVAAFNFSLGPVMWILFSEVFATQIRAIAIPASALVASVFGGIIVPAFFPWQLENQGAATTFWIYVGFCVLGFLFSYKYVPETKNKTIEDIEFELSVR